MCARTRANLRGPRDLLKFACKWRHQPVRVPGAGGASQMSGAKSISRPLPSCPAVHALYRDETLPRCSPALPPLPLAPTHSSQWIDSQRPSKNTKTERRREGSVIKKLIKASHRASFFLFHQRACFKEIPFLSPLNINRNTPTVKRVSPSAIWKK